MYLLSTHFVHLIPGYMHRVHWMHMRLIAWVRGFINGVESPGKGKVEGGELGTSPWWL